MRLWLLLVLAAGEFLSNEEKSCERFKAFMVPRTLGIRRRPATSTPFRWRIYVSSIPSCTSVEPETLRFRGMTW